MTSVKELGETLKKRRTIVEREDEVSEEEVGLTPTSAAYAALLVVSGCLALGGGAFLASSLVIAPELAWIADSLQRMGITSGAVLAGGVSLLGLGLVCKAIGRTHRSLSGHLRSENGLSALTDSQADLRDGLDKVQFELRVLHESTRQLLEIAHEQTLKRSSHHPDDAVLQLAASLDQLGARLEDRLESQHTGMQQRLSSLDHSLEDTRRRLSTFAEEAKRRNAEANAQANAPPKATTPLPAATATATSKGNSEKGELRPSGERRAPTPTPTPTPTTSTSTTTTPTPTERSARPRTRPEVQKPRPADDDELHVLVTLEDRDEDVRKSERLASTSLGLLDELGDFSELASAREPRPLKQPERVEASEAKLEQLKSLLADQGLRKALEDLRRDEDGRPRA